MSSTIDHAQPELGERVACLAGVPRDLGRPLGTVVALGPVNVKVRLAYDGREVYVPRTGIDRIDARCAARPPARPPRFPKGHGARVVVIPCGGAKLDRPAPAGELYTGSYHRAARRAADELGGRLLILSAKYGLLDPDTVVEPYDLRMGQPGTVDDATLAAQADELGVGKAARVIVLAGRAYADRIVALRPDAELPLAGTRGIGDQLARLATIARTRSTTTTQEDPAMTTDPTPSYPTVTKVTLLGPAPDGGSWTGPVADPDVARMIADGWRVARTWDVPVVPAGCTGRLYHVNPDNRDEGIDVRHDEPCPVHHPADDGPLDPPAGDVDHAADDLRLAADDLRLAGGDRNVARGIAAERAIVEEAADTAAADTAAVEVRPAGWARMTTPAELAELNVVEPIDGQPLDVEADAHRAAKARVEAELLAGELGDRVDLQGPDVVAEATVPARADAAASELLDTIPPADDEDDPELDVVEVLDTGGVRIDLDATVAFVNGALGRPTAPVVVDARFLPPDAAGHAGYELTFVSPEVRQRAAGLIVEELPGVDGVYIAELDELAARLAVRFAAAAGGRTVTAGYGDLLGDVDPGDGPEVHTSDLTPEEVLQGGLDGLQRRKRALDDAVTGLAGIGSRLAALRSSVRAASAAPEPVEPAPADVEALQALDTAQELLDRAQALLAANLDVAVESADLVRRTIADR